MQSAPTVGNSENRIKSRKFALCKDDIRRTPQLLHCVVFLCSQDAKRSWKEVQSNVYLLAASNISCDKTSASLVALVPLQWEVEEILASNASIYEKFAERSRKLGVNDLSGRNLHIPLTSAIEL